MTSEKSVLVVDDEPLIREILMGILRKADYSVFEAASAEAAIDVMNANRIGVILVDRRMPGRDGDWLIEQVQDRFAETAVVLATGEYVPPKISLQRGVVGHLSKPFTVEAVRSAVADASVWHQVAARNKSPR